MFQRQDLPAVGYCRAWQGEQGRRLIHYARVGLAYLGVELLFVIVVGTAHRADDFLGSAFPAGFGKTVDVGGLGLLA